MKDSLNIFDSVVSENIKEITTDILEAGIDQLIDNDFLKDIPILGIGFNAYSLTQKISASFFTKKIIKFLFQLKEIPQEKRIEFVSRLEDQKENKKAGETILTILNRLDDLNKATIIGRLFKTSILGKITYSEFLRLSHIVDKTFLDDLIKLKSDAIYDLEDETMSILYQSGLLKQKLKDTQAFADYVSEQLGSSKEYSPPIFEYEVNNFGKMLISFGL